MKALISFCILHFAFCLSYAADAPVGLTLSPSPLQAAGASAATPAGPAPLRVAVDATMPPLIFKTGDKFSGMEAEFARGLGESLGRPIVFVQASSSDLISALLGNQADIVMSGMSVTTLRLVRVAFCDPYLRVGQVAMCRNGDLSSYANNDNIANIHSPIGVVAGSTADALVGAQFSFAHHDTFASLPEAVQALLAKKVDLVVTDYPLALWQCSENEATLAVIPTELDQEDFAWSVRKDDDQLRQAANAYLAQIKKSGQLAELVRKWFPVVTAAAIGPAPSAMPGTAAAATPAASAQSNSAAGSKGK